MKRVVDVRLHNNSQLAGFSKKETPHPALRATFSPSDGEKELLCWTIYPGWRPCGGTYPELQSGPPLGFSVWERLSALAESHSA